MAGWGLAWRGAAASSRSPAWLRAARRRGGAGLARSSSEDVEEEDARESDAVGRADEFEAYLSSRLHGSAGADAESAELDLELESAAMDESMDAELLGAELDLDAELESLMSGTAG